MTTKRRVRSPRVRTVRPRRRSRPLLSRAPSGWRAPRLGVLECALLTLIAVAVAITLAMAILNPSSG